MSRYMFEISDELNYDGQPVSTCPTTIEWFG